jgi:hypothetical protein
MMHNFVNGKAEVLEWLKNANAMKRVGTVADIGMLLTISLFLLTH